MLSCFEEIVVYSYFVFEGIRRFLQISNHIYLYAFKYEMLKCCILKSLRKYILNIYTMLSIFSIQYCEFFKGILWNRAFQTFKVMSTYLWLDIFTSFSFCWPWCNCSGSCCAVGRHFMLRRGFTGGFLDVGWFSGATDERGFGVGWRTEKALSRSSLCWDSASVEQKT